MVENPTTTSSTCRRSYAEKRPRPEVATSLRRIRRDGTDIELVITDRGDGDFHIDAAPERLESRWAAVMPGRWAVVRQVHGSTVVAADPEQTPEADGIYTAAAEQPIAVQGADCAPIALLTDRGPIGLVHAGWRGLAAGVIENMANTLRSHGAVIEAAIVGPVIGPECYEFGARDLDEVATALGQGVRAQTPQGTPALNMAAGIEMAASRAGIEDLEFIGGCTSCSFDGFSHRARQEKQRHAMVARIVAHEEGS